MFRFRLLLSFLLMAGIAGGALYYLQQGGQLDSSRLLQQPQLQRLLADSPLKTVNNSLNAEQFQEVQASVEEQSSQLLERSGKVLGESKKFLDESIQPSSKEVPLHQRALEQAQYLYCKQLVAEYEAQGAGQAGEMSLTE